MIKIKSFDQLFEGYNRISYEFGKTNDGKELDVVDLIGFAVISKLPVGQLFDNAYLCESLRNEIQKYIGDGFEGSALDVANEIIKDDEYMSDLYDTIVTSAASDKVLSMEEVKKIETKK